MTTKICKNPGLYWSWSARFLVALCGAPLSNAPAQELTLGEALDAPGFVWHTDNVRPWAVDTNVFLSGGSSLVAGGMDGGAYRLFLDVQGPGTLSFNWRLSSNSYGFIQCELPGREVLAALWHQSGNDSVWSSQTVYLPADVTVVGWTLIAEQGWLDTVGFSTGGTAPQFVEQPRTLTIVPQGSAVLRTVVVGTSPFSYAWLRNGTNVPDASGPTLRIENLIAGSTNVFTCVVSNSFGIAITDAAVIRVLGRPSDPQIRFSCIPPISSFLDVRGVVWNAVISNYVVAPYIQAWVGWWNKPYWASPTVQITTNGPDGLSGTFAFDYTSGGIDYLAASMAVFLIPQDYSPPLVGGQSLPEDIFTHAVACSIIDRVPGSPTMRVMKRQNGTFAFSVENTQPDNWFAIEATDKLSDSAWQLLPSSTKRYTNGVEHILQPTGSANFFRAVCVPIPPFDG